MTIFTASLRKILGNNPWEVEDHAPALFSTYDKAVDYAKRMLGNNAECEDFVFLEEWKNPKSPNRIIIIEERAVDTQ